MLCTNKMSQITVRTQINIIMKAMADLIHLIKEITESSSDITHAQTEPMASSFKACTVDNNKQDGGKYNAATNGVLSDIAIGLNTRESWCQLVDLVNDLMFISDKPGNDKVQQKLEQDVRPENCHSIV